MAVYFHAKRNKNGGSQIHFGFDFNGFLMYIKKAALAEEKTNKNHNDNHGENSKTTVLYNAKRAIS